MPLDFENMSCLTFDQGRFLLTRPMIAHAKEISGDSEWARRPNGDYETMSLRAAAAFRTRGDLIAEKIFKRAFQEFYTLPSLPPLPHLDGHQREGVHFVLSRKRSYLAHCAGAGKTAVAITASLLMDATPGPVLFIVPPQLVKNWEREIWKFTEEFPVYPTIGIVPTTDKKERAAWRSDFILCPDSMLARPWVYEELLKIGPRFVAVDEASRFKDSSAERSLAFYGGSNKGRSFEGLFKDARHVVLLDGSPMPNRPMELWAPLYALDPESIGCMSQRDFGFRYCGAQMNERGQYEFKHSTNEKELKLKIQTSFMQVVTEDRLSHPERLRKMILMTDDPRSPEYKSWERTNLSGLKLEGLDENASQGDFARFRGEIGMRKVPWVARYVGDRVKYKNESVLVFAWHRGVVDALCWMLEDLTPGRVYGGVAAIEREACFEKFQAGEIKVLVMNIAAAGRGHNLQRADRAVFAEYSWSDELNKQCEKRGSRRGNEKLSLPCDYIVAPGSFDERMLSSVFTKEKRVERIIG